MSELERALSATDASERLEAKRRDFVLTYGDGGEEVFAIDGEMEKLLLEFIDRSPIEKWAQCWVIKGPTHPVAFTRDSLNGGVMRRRRSSRQQPSREGFLAHRTHEWP